MASQRRSLDRRVFLGSLGSAFVLAACAPTGGGIGTLRSPASGRRGSGSAMALTITNKTGQYANDQIFFYNVGTDPAGVFYHQLPDGSLAECDNCYAFAFDDQCGYSSDLSDPAPTELNITLGPF
jgi:hypothetical protein